MRRLIMLTLLFGAVPAIAEAQQSTSDVGYNASVVPQSASAAPQSGLPAAGEGFGAETRYWTSLQLSGAAASPVARPQPGEVATRSYERYLKSFTYPIPDKFGRDSFSSDSNGGSGSSGGGGSAR